MFIRDEPMAQARSSDAELDPPGADAQSVPRAGPDDPCYRAEVSSASLSRQRAVSA